MFWLCLLSVNLRPFLQGTLTGERRIVYWLDKPLACGARLWIEADDAVISDSDGESES